jgi:hypothetical protein
LGTGREDEKALLDALMPLAMHDLVSGSFGAGVTVL